MWTADEQYGQLIGSPQPTATSAPDVTSPGPERVIRTMPLTAGLRDNPLLFLIVLVALVVLLVRFSFRGSFEVAG